MTIEVVPKSWSYVKRRWQTDNGIQVSDSGSVNDRFIDEKPLLPTKNAWDSTGWRKPSAWWHYGQSGDVETTGLFVDVKALGGLSCTGSGNVNCAGSWKASFPPVDQSMIDAAVTKALLKLKDSDVNWAQNLGERKQTASLVFDSCVRLARMGRDARNAFRSQRDFEKFFLKDFSGNPVKTLANYWLELQYGWKPLLSDVHSAVTNLMGKNNDRGRIHVTAGSQDRFYESREIPDSTLGINVFIERVLKGVTNVKVRLDYEQDDNPTLRTLAQTGLANPIDLAWELLPFSFVVDWFIPIGDYFNCLDATLGWQFLGGTQSIMQRMNVRAGAARSIDPAFFGPVFTTGKKGSYFNMSRSVYSSSPLPERPHFSDKSSSMHVANGIALLASVFLDGSKVR